MTQDHVTEALASLRQGNFAAARSYIQIYAQNNTRDAKHYLIEGLACLAQADWAAARDVFIAASTDFPDQAQLWFNRGLAEENLGKLDDAAASYQRCVGLKPDYGEAYGNLSNIYRRQGRFPEAVQMACRAIATDAPKADALNVLALALGKQGNFSEAEKALDEALTLAPDEAAFLANRANLAVDQLKFEEAWGFFAAARARDDNAIIRRDEGMARMLAADYAQGLPLYESRLDLPNALRVHPLCPRWSDESLSGKTLLLVAEQGFGDTIQFSRYAQKLVEAGANLVWSVRPPLQRLLAMNLPGQIVTEEGINLRNTGTTPDYWLPILSLPLALGMTAAMPPSSPAFTAPHEPKLPNATAKRKIGLVWSGSPTHERDHERSIPLPLLAPLWATIDAHFYAPFKGAAASLKNTTSPIIPLDHLINDFADTAALLSQMDCLITVDTAAAHLAGALGVKTYVLLPFCPDWRWGTEGTTTPWYESVTLLRQTSYGDWRTVVESLLRKL